MALATVAGESGVPADILNGPEDRTPEGLQAFADKITAYVGAATAPRTPKPDPNQGRQGDIADKDAQARAFFGL